MAGPNNVCVQCPAEKCESNGQKDLKWYPKKFTAFNKTFFEVNVLINNTICKWLYVLALPQEAKNFYYHACMKNSMGEVVTTYYEQARSMVFSYKEIIENGHCFLFHQKRIENMDGTDYVDFSVKIRNLKDEAKDDDEESGIDD